MAFVFEVKEVVDHSHDAEDGGEVDLSQLPAARRHRAGAPEPDVGVHITLRGLLIIIWAVSFLVVLGHGLFVRDLSLLWDFVALGGAGVTGWAFSRYDGNPPMAG